MPLDNFPPHKPMPNIITTITLHRQNGMLCTPLDLKRVLAALEDGSIDVQVNTDSNLTIDDIATDCRLTQTDLVLEVEVDANYEGWASPTQVLAMVHDGIYVGGLTELRLNLGRWHSAIAK